MQAPQGGYAAAVQTGGSAAARAAQSICAALCARCSRNKTGQNDEKREKIRDKTGQNIEKWGEKTQTGGKDAVSMPHGSKKMDRSRRMVPPAPAAWEARKKDLGEGNTDAVKTCCAQGKLALPVRAARRRHLRRRAAHRARGRRRALRRPGLRWPSRRRRRAVRPCRGSAAPSRASIHRRPSRRSRTGR